MVFGGTLFVAVHHALLFAGQQYVTSAVAAVVICLDPILAAGFARVLLPGERLSLLGGLGLLLGLCGVAVVANPTPAALAGSETIGVLLVALAAASFALGAGLLHLGALLLPVGRFGSITWSGGALAALAYLAVVAAGGGYLLYFALLDRVGPVEVNLVAYAAPVFAALGGWLPLGAGLTPHTVAGFGLITAGFCLVKRRALREELRGLRAGS